MPEVPVKVLVADDSITVRKIAERQLHAAGFDVALAASGEEALAWLSRERPDVIISDVIMPDKSGYEVCAFVRAHAELASTPVLLISGIVNEEVTKQAVSCRADGVLKKPFQGSSLKEQVTALLAKRTRSVVPEAEAPPASQAAGLAAGKKAYRITEEQLQGFRQTIARVRELEGLLAEERARSARLRQRVADAERLLSQTSALHDELRRVLQEAGERTSERARPKSAKSD